ncbi:hypothetical protein [Streptomyces sp. NPDC048669]|uniref:hypothetical protein n=1 Tax=Streptomyces sp. NPDC048669 TaxID=3155267 RepID=UPI0034202C74
MIQITLGKQKDVDPNSDPLQRSQIGWSDGLSGQQLYEVARGVWVMPGSRVERERFAVVNGGGVICLAMEIERVVDVPGGRRFFEGRILGPGHSAYDRYVGKPAPNGAQQNPITYFKSSLDNRKCNCGCGKLI